MLQMSHGKYYSSWFLIVLIMGLAMVAIGGATRLTESGLSITEWRPLAGALPPLSEEAWQSEFEKYKKIPQYTQKNSGMKISDFKKIYFWEFIHRLWGRLVGLVLFAALVHSLLTKKFSRWFGQRILFIGVLGVVQGFIGWLMVQTGLSHRTSVSAISLTAHYFAAAILLIFVYDSFLKSRGSSNLTFQKDWKNLSLAAFVLLQVFLGCLVAGNKLGHYFATYPSYGQAGLPAGFQQSLMNLDSILFLVFHRGLGTFLGLLSIWMLTTKNNSYRILGAHLFFQAIIGILTIWTGINIYLAVIHQVTGMAIILSIYKILRENLKEDSTGNSTENLNIAAT